MKTLLLKNKSRAIKVRTLRDVEHAKELYRYEMEISSQALTRSLKRTKFSIGQTIKNPLQDITRNIIYSFLMNVLRPGK